MKALELAWRPPFELFSWLHHYFINRIAALFMNHRMPGWSGGERGQGGAMAHRSLLEYWQANHYSSPAFFNTFSLIDSDILKLALSIKPRISFTDFITLFSLALINTPKDPIISIFNSSAIFLPFHFFW